MNLDVALDHVRGDSLRLAAIAREHDLGTPIASCPGWDLRQLVTHTSAVQRWATAAVRTGERPDAPPDPGPADDPSAWLTDGMVTLVDVLAAADPDSPAWNPFPVEQTVGVWIRRMVHETAIHRWDAENAIGVDGDLDPEVSSDGIDEHFSLGVPRVLDRERVEPPASSLHIHCTDVDGEWLVTTDEGYSVVREHRKGDAALRGPAADLLLVLMGRRPIDTVGVAGDPRAAEEWLALPGR